ncbi:MAG: hypothetical protein R3D52_07310 [Xanthobacteraceae bacterium]
MFFDQSGKKTSLLPEELQALKRRKKLARSAGEFPEGAAVKWGGGRSRGDSDHIGDSGLISRCGGSSHLRGVTRIISSAKPESSTPGADQK